MDAVMRSLRGLKEAGFTDRQSLAILNAISALTTNESSERIVDLGTEDDGHAN